MATDQPFDKAKLWQELTAGAKICCHAKAGLKHHTLHTDSRDEATVVFHNLLQQPAGVIETACAKYIYIYVKIVIFVVELFIETNQ